MSMDIEDLNKSQIILLTLLVSFVTSIATGIVTVSLMEKAPKDVVRVTQKVVERVVEKAKEVSPTKEKEPVKEKIIEKTVIVKEGDLIAQAIAENRTKLLAIHDKDTGEFLAFAAPIKSRFLLTDNSIYQEGKVYVAKNSQSDSYEIEYIKGGGARGLALFRLKNDELNLRSISLHENGARLGQSVFTFSSQDFSSVLQGIVSSLKGSFIYADFRSDDMQPGSLLFDSQGKLLAISTEKSRAVSMQAFVAQDAIAAFVSNTEEAESQGQQYEQSDSDTNGEQISSENLQNITEGQVEAQVNEQKTNSQNASAASSI